MTVTARFQSILDRIEPTVPELLRYERHRKTVEGRLSSAFPGTQVFKIGSHARGTAIRGSSDLDLLCRLSRETLTRGGKLMTSDTALRYLKEQIMARYSQRVDVRRDGQAVVVSFSGDDSVDVVPGVWCGMIGPPGRQRPMYEIPDGDGGWMLTSPPAHDRFIEEASTASGHKLRRVAQIIKYWRRSRSTPLPLMSFYIDMMLATSGVCAGVATYAELTARAFEHLYRTRCAPIEDPIGMGKEIRATKTSAQAQLLREAVRTSFEHSQRALALDSHGTRPDAYAQWDAVFSGTFPKT